MIPISKNSPSGKVSEFIASPRMVGHVDLGSFGQIVVPVPGVKAGWFANVNLPEVHADDYLFLGQHCHANEVHVIVLNLGRASGDFDDVIRILLTVAPNL